MEGNKSHMSSFDSFGIFSPYFSSGKVLPTLGENEAKEKIFFTKSAVKIIGRMRLFCAVFAPEEEVCMTFSYFREWIFHISSLSHR